MSAAIYYHPEAYTTSNSKLMGRNAAGQSFLKGYFLHSAATEFWVQTQSKGHLHLFAETAKENGRGEKIHALNQARLGELAKPGAIYYPEPGLGEHAFLRSHFGHGSWSICGITHTTSSARAMDAIANILTSPVYPWDALICTSTAVKNNVIKILQAQKDFLTDRLGISKLVLPELPVIPLGVHTKDFEFSNVAKTKARESLAIDPNTIVVLFTGRLSFHAKAHPLAMYEAIQRASNTTRKKVTLIECGWYANDFIQNSFTQASKFAAPDVDLLTIDGRDAELRNYAWACADIFCSLSDNIQETFGITPIEAMASGIPVVVSDWDGYKDTVRDGIDGFRIPTLMPPAGLGGDLALSYALELDTYDQYCGNCCSLVAVDIELTTLAFSKLFESSSMREQMGQAGKGRASSVYDWSKIIPEYEQLWSNLGEIRRSQKSELSRKSKNWPARMDPFWSFSSYPTKTLQIDMKFSLVDINAGKALARYKLVTSLDMVSYSKIVMPTESEIIHVFETLNGGPLAAQDLIKRFADDRKYLILRALVWLTKIGLLKLA